MPDFEDAYLPPRSGRRSDRTFADAHHDTPQNAKAWKDAIAAVARGDAQAIAKAFDEARGEVAPLSSKGTPRRNACAKAVLALRSDPQAWARLRRGERYDHGEAHIADADWTPYSVDLLAYLWAANPEALGRAAGAWREARPDGRDSWKFPFLTRGWWQSQISPAQPLRAEASRLFGPPVGAPNPDIARERSALESILAQSARVCLDQLLVHEEAACDKRSKGETVWARGGSEWGLAWANPSTLAEPIASIPDGPDGRLLATPFDPLERAVELAMAQALDLSPEDGAEAFRRVAITLADSHPPLARKAWATLAAASPRAAFPLRIHDWIGPRQLSALALPAQALGDWLAAVGSKWNIPAHTNHDKSIAIGQPHWSSQGSRGDPSPDGMADWSMLEWMVVLGHGAAACQACRLGAQLHPQFEKALRRSRFGDGEAAPAAFAWIEACRIAESIPSPQASVRARSIRI